MSVRTIAAAKPSAVLAASTTSAQIFTDAINTAIAAILNLPGSKRFEQKRFSVRASGVVTTASSATVVPTLYVGTSLTPGSNVVLGAATAVTVATASAPWWLEAILLFDSTSGKLNGSFQAMVNNTLYAAAALSNVVTGLSSSTEPAIQFVAGITFSAASASNTANMGEFVVED